MAIPSVVDQRYNDCETPIGALTEIKRLSALILLGLALAFLPTESAGAAASRAAADAAQSSGRSALVDFAQAVGLNDVEGFVDTIAALIADGKLPARYISKGEAERSGWRPGTDLCRVAPGRTIGGDRFGNREGRLPARPGRRWTEADLDYACGARGAKRLVFSSDGLFYVTVDHYRTFHAVPK